MLTDMRPCSSDMLKPPTLFTLILLSAMPAASALQVMDMPLLFETGAYLLTWPRVLVAADPATQV